MEEQIAYQKELQKTEKELIIKEKEDFCQIHRGPLSGITYVCPKCKTKYCLKCAQTLKIRDEHCWTCDAEIKIDIDVKAGDSSIIKKNGVDKIINILEEDIPLEDMKGLDKLNLTTLSENFIKKLNKLDMIIEEKREFVQEMLALTPEERNSIIDRMLESKNDDFLG